MGVAGFAGSATTDFRRGDDRKQHHALFASPSGMALDGWTLFATSRYFCRDDALEELSAR
jgi:hypothetical protein